MNKLSKHYRNIVGNIIGLLINYFRKLDENDYLISGDWKKNNKY